jgi:hypothetical protein
MKPITANGCCPYCGRQLLQVNNAGDGFVIRTPVVILTAGAVSVPCRHCKQPVELGASPARPAHASPPAVPVVVRRRALTP